MALIGNINLPVFHIQKPGNLDDAPSYIEISLGNSCDNLFGVLQLREFDLSVKFTFVLI